MPSWVRPFNTYFLTVSLELAGCPVNAVRRPRQSFAQWRPSALWSAAKACISRASKPREICSRRAGWPCSVKMVGRDLKNVQDDLRILERYGLVRMSRGRAMGKRRVKTPRAVFGEIALGIAV